MSSYELIIVESPSKARTLSTYLDSNYKIIATLGHIIDLPKKELGVDIENRFQPEWTVMKGKAKTIKSIKDSVKYASKIYLATDPDREGEAIAYHLEKIFLKKKSIIQRIELHEINKNSLLNALKNGKSIDYSLVDAQIARRVLDRIVGYMISPILWRKLKPGLSAGRVQSVALKWICEREKEIINFKSEKYYIPGFIAGNKKGSGKFTLNSNDKINSIEDVIKIYSNIIKLEYNNILNKKYSNIKIEEYNNILNDYLNNNSIEFNISKANREVKQKFPFPAHITSTLQQEASIRYGFSPKKTMQVAQKLYEGVRLKSGETSGLITYMRTDSSRINPEIQKQAINYISDNYGDRYCGAYRFKNKDNAQDAHEAIRPTNLKNIPENIKNSLSPDEFNIYKLIWDRFISSNMAPEKYEKIKVFAKLGEYEFVSEFKNVLFEGFNILKEEKIKGEKFPGWEEGEILKIEKIEISEKETEPPSRYTEASLIEKLEKTEIGRPSTYASIVEVLLKRKYIVKKKKSLYPTDIGQLVNDFLKESFSEIIDDLFTKKMEEELDKITIGKLEYYNVLNEFYKKFLEYLDKSKKIYINKKQNVEKEICPECKTGVLVKKISRKSKSYLICNRFPECEYSRYETAQTN